MEPDNSHIVATPIIARANLSIPINGVFVPFKSVADAIRRFCVPAFFHHENQPAFDLSKVGSAFLFDIGDVPSAF